MKWWQKIIIKALYFTPVGYVLGLLSLLDGGNIQGLKITPFRKDMPLVTIKENPTTKDRLTWFFSGAFLVAQGWFTIEFFLRQRILEQFTFWYAALAFLFGIIAIFSAIFPRFFWNKKLW